MAVLYRALDNPRVPAPHLGRGGPIAAGLCLAIWIVTSACTPTVGATSSTSDTASSSSLTSDLTGVACPSVSFCLAAGVHYDSPPAGHYPNERTLIERWNGSSWSLVASPNSAAGTSTLARVSCGSTSLCFAVGWVGPYLPAGQVLIERWDGSLWSIAGSPKAASARSSALHDVSCASATFCVAVGQYTDASANVDGLIEQWNGSSWRVVPFQHQGGLDAVICVSPWLCFTAGHYYTYQTGHEVGLGYIEQWNGSSWSISAWPDSNVDVLLQSMSCVSGSRCFATGLHGKGQGTLDNHTLIEEWNGTSWSAVPSPNPSPSDNWLDGVSCASASVCVATGYQRTDTTYHTLIEQWNGASWTIARAPEPRTTLSVRLSQVGCPSISHCFAIGGYNSPTSGHWLTLVEQWNGSSWSIVSSPNQTG